MAQEICWEQLQDTRKAIVALYRLQMMSIIRLVVEDIDIVETFDELIMDSILPYNGTIKGHIREAKNRFPHVISNTETYFEHGSKVKCKFCNKILGWRCCLDNPNGYCEYNYKISLHIQKCVYCGLLEDRESEQIGE